MLEKFVTEGFPFGTSIRIKLKGCLDCDLEILG
jgi:hypothetical protein